MKMLFLMGRSEAGKTSLTQILSGEELHYHKTQYTNTGTDIIDSPGEYSETKRCGLGLACFSFEADVLALLMAADEPFSVFEANCQCFTNRPLIGIITKIDSPYANVPMVRNWMVNSGCERIFEVSNLTREGIQELLDYLQEDPVRRTLEQAKARQRLSQADSELERLVGTRTNVIARKLRSVEQLPEQQARELLDDAVSSIDLPGQS